MDIALNVKSAFQPETAITGAVGVEVIYLRAVAPSENEPSPQPVSQTLRLILDSQLQGKVEVNDAVNNQIKVNQTGKEEEISGDVGDAEVIFASAGRQSDPKEHIVLVGGASNSYNGFGKETSTGFVLNPAPTTLGDVDDFINASKGNVTHDKYWANFLEPVTRLFTNGISKPKVNDIVTILVYYPPYLMREERDWASSPYNTMEWLNSPWVSGKDPYDPTVRATDQGVVTLKQIPTRPKAKPNPNSINFSAQQVSEKRIDHEILMRTTSEAKVTGQTYEKRPHLPHDWRDQIHNIPRSIVFGPMLGGNPVLKGVLVKIILVSDPQQILNYMSTGTLDSNARRWLHILDTRDEEDMANAENPSINDMDEMWWDVAFAPKDKPKAGQRPSVPAAWRATPNVDRKLVQIARFDYFGHSNEDSLFLKYGWENSKGDSVEPEGEVFMTADDFNTALTGSNAIDKNAKAKLWGCSLANDFGQKFTTSFATVEASDDLTSFDNILSTPSSMPEPIPGGTFKTLTKPVTI